MKQVAAIFANPPPYLIVGVDLAKINSVREAAATVKAQQRKAQEEEDQAARLANLLEEGQFCLDASTAYLPQDGAL